MYLQYNTISTQYINLKAQIRRHNTNILLIMLANMAVTSLAVTLTVLWQCKHNVYFHEKCTKDVQIYPKTIKNTL